MGVFTHYTGPTSFKYVSAFKTATRNRLVYVGHIFGKSKTFQLERDAALWVDKMLIEHNKEPVNILKRKV